MLASNTPASNSPALWPRLLAGLALCLGMAACATAQVGGGGGGDVVDAGSDIDAFGNRPDSGENALCPTRCTILPQCGCGNDACDLDLEVLEEGGGVCRAVGNPGVQANACATFNDCAPAHVCLGGQCRAYCDAENPCEGGICLIQISYENAQGEIETVPNVKTCTTSCQPEQGTDNGCPEAPDFGCVLLNAGEPVQGNETFFADCRPAGNGGNNATCTGADGECRSGFDCVTLNGNNVCKQTCRVGAGAVCAAGTCNSYGTPLFVNGVEYGACI